MGFRAAPVLPIAGRCGRGRSKFSHSSFPADEAASPVSGEARACSQRVFSKRPLLRIFRLRVAEQQRVAQVHLLPGTLLPQRKLWERSGSPAARNTNPAADCFGLKRLRRILLQSRDQAVHETLPPLCHCVLALVFVSHSLLFALSEDPGCAGTYD